MLDDHIFAVILAGGSGTRFWPKSRSATPKQLCRIGDAEKTMIEQTLARLDSLVPPERRLIVTHTNQIEATRKICGNQCGHYIAEPDARNTANALALANIFVERHHKGPKSPVMISLHADHVIRREDAFCEALKQCAALAETGVLTLLGIKPAYAETGYGYIERGESLAGWKDSYKVASFREKPEKPLADEYFASGKFYWNAGIFAWQAATLRQEFLQHHPVPIEKLDTIADFDHLDEIYATLPKIAIDHAILEVSKNICVLEGDIDWQDVGSWDALDNCFPTDGKGNYIVGDVWTEETTRSTIDSDGPFVACLGIDDLVVVANRGAVLVCPKDRAQEVKKVVTFLKDKGRNELL